MPVNGAGPSQQYVFMEKIYKAWNLTNKSPDEPVIFMLLLLEVAYRLTAKDKER